MKPPSFKYFDPASIDAALELLHEHQEDAKLLAGGQSLVPLLNFRMARPQVVIDLNRIEALSYLREEEGWLAVGAMTRQRMIEDSNLVRKGCGILTDTMELIGHPQIRNRGTVGGSLVHADPAAELTAIARLLDARMTVKNRNGERLVAAEDFFVGVFTTSIEPSEMLTEVRFPRLGPKTGWAFEEFAVRHGDFAVAGVAALVTLDEGGVCEEGRLAAIAAGETAFRDSKLESMLKGEKLTDALVDEVAHRLASSVDPFDDLHASAAQRRHLTGVLAKRALKKAAHAAAARNRLGEKT